MTAQPHLPFVKGNADAFHVEVVRSARRKKTVQARLDGTRLKVMIPASFSMAEEAEYVADMVARFRRRTDAERVDVEARAAALADRYGLPRPKAVQWVDNQHARWGSCSIDAAEIRLSTAMAGYPRWVIDYVIVHELAHLVEPNHSKAFWSIVNRYPKAERARGFLIAKGLDGE